MKRSERLKPIIAAILDVVRNNEYDIIDVWLAYRLLTLQIEMSLETTLDDFIREAYYSPRGKPKQEPSKVAIV